MSGRQSAGLEQRSAMERTLFISAFATALTHAFAGLTFDDQRPRERWDWRARESKRLLPSIPAECASAARWYEAVDRVAALGADALIADLGVLDYAASRYPHLLCICRQGLPPITKHLDFMCAFGRREQCCRVLSPKQVRR